MTNHLLIQHLKTLEEIGRIMTALKNLSLIEINKTVRNIQAQKKMMDTISQMGSDLLESYPHLFQYLKIEHTEIYILIGSERGFCSGFNENILRKVIDLPSVSKFIVIGRKLADKLMEDSRVIKNIPGCNAIQEIDKVISSLLDFLSTTQTLPNQWALVYNAEEQNKAVTNILRPLLELLAVEKRQFPFPPLLYQATDIFFSEFINHYLFSLFYHNFYKSFLAENYQRIHHLQSALDHLNKKKVSLRHHLNLIRQEEITEEIELIMLTVEAMLKDVYSECGMWPE